MNYTNADLNGALKLLLLFTMVCVLCRYTLYRILNPHHPPVEERSFWSFVNPRDP